MMNKMSIYRCISCTNEYNISKTQPFCIPCGDIFCEQCVLRQYNKKNNTIICPLHKKEFKIEFNKFSNYFDTLTNINRACLEEKDIGLYCKRHNKKRLKFFCENDNNFLCENCLSQHEGHKYIEFNLNRENFFLEINSLKKKFENLKNRYLNEKSRINQYFVKAKKNFEEQMDKINIYFKNLILLINDKKSEMILKIKNYEKINLKKLENIENIFLISDEKYNFINNEFYYITNELLNKGEYETFYKTRNNFYKLIENFNLYLNKNIFNNKELYNNKMLNYICPNNDILEMNKFDNNKEENICGKIEEIIINFNNNNSKLNPLDIKANSLLNTYLNKHTKNKQNKFENEKINIEDQNNAITKNKSNLDSSLLDKKSFCNDGDSFLLDKQMIESGYTFYLINKNDVKNVFKQQENENIHNDINNNKDNSIYNNKNDSFINNLNNINQIKKHNSLINNNNIILNQLTNNNTLNRNNNLLNKINESKKKKAPYKLLNIIDNNKEAINYKKKENINKYKKIERTKEINSNLNYLKKNNNIIKHNIKSEENKNKIGKENLCKINNKRNNSIKRYYNKNNNIVLLNNNIRENSLNNKKLNNKNISYIYTNNNKTNKSIISNNLINSYNKEYSNEYNMFNNNKISNKNKSQILTDINEDSMTYKIRNNPKILKSESSYNFNNKNRKIISSKYSSRDLNNRVLVRYESNNITKENELKNKRGKSTRHKNSFSDMEIII